jgi:hypothetical protein
VFLLKNCDLLPQAGTIEKSVSLASGRIFGSTDVPGFWSVKGFKVTVLTLMVFNFMCREVLIYFKPYEGQLKSLSIMMQCAEIVEMCDLQLISHPTFSGF